eukprot:TRINITY_DN5247_c0_g1_i2.p1 TRINITY_DN5247_c0_g1~~TRINITY_DN5247_c0_g1_i2.p1  ORF type:complete len:521 (+),score=89.68 TRINITY_DN5247_c0_g1_i2:76-1563(+)
MQADPAPDLSERRRAASGPHTALGGARSGAPSQRSPTPDQRGVHAHFRHALPPFGNASTACSEHPLSFLFDGKCSGRRYLIDREYNPVPPGMGHSMAAHNPGLKLALLLGLTYFSAGPIQFGHAVGVALTERMGLHRLLSLPPARPPRGARRILLPRTIVGTMHVPGQKGAVPPDWDRYRAAAAAAAAAGGPGVVFELQPRVSAPRHVDGEYGISAWLLRAAWWMANGARLRGSAARCGGAAARVVVHWRVRNPFDSSGNSRTRLLNASYYTAVVSQVLADLRAAGELRRIEVVLHRQKPLRQKVAGSVADLCSDRPNCTVRSVYGANISDLLEDASTADVFVTSRSGLSHLAAILAKRGQLVLYAPMWHSYDFAPRAIAVGSLTADAVSTKRCTRVYRNGSHHVVPWSATGSAEAVYEAGRGPYNSAAFRRLYRGRLSAPRPPPCGASLWCAQQWSSWAPPPAGGRLCAAGRAVGGVGGPADAAGWEALFACGD